MPPAADANWSDALLRALQSYDEFLLRKVAARLLRPRGQWPLDELIRRCHASAEDVTLVSRRLKELEPVGRQLLALIGHSRQPLWNLGNLVELAMALGNADGLGPVLDLLEAGLLFPLDANRRIGTFEHWLSFATPATLLVFAHPLAPARALGEPLPLDEPDEVVTAVGPAHEADGLDWLLCLAALWQSAAVPFRRTQQGDFFKRDLERLQASPLLQGPAAAGAALPDAPLLAVTLAERLGIVADVEGELRAGMLPAAWEGSLAEVLASLFAELFRVERWNALDGWKAETAGNPFPGAYLLMLLRLSRLPAAGWARPAALEAWLQEVHPYWRGEDMRPSRRQPWVEAFFQGLAAPLRLVQTARDAEGGTVVRLAPLGRWLLGLGESPPPAPAFPRTLLVQPNLEVLAYRQGLTPGLLRKLTLLANWKTLGAACTLQLEPDSVYRALEAGLTFEAILRLLEQHGTRTLSASVVDLLRTWSNKRERLTVYPAATLLEFNTAADLTEALARGLAATRLSDRLAVVASEGDINYSHFRLTSTRDYGLPPEKCVEVAEDGVTLTVDVSRSDLLLETEISRFAEMVDGSGANGRRHYRLTPASLTAARTAGLHAQALEQWFQQRTGEPLTPAAMLLLTGPQAAPPQLRRELILHLPSASLADGLLQWPQTAVLVEERLGPTAVRVREENVAALRQRLAEAGLTLPEPS